MTQGPAVERRLIFLSHANPEDNQFTLWLAARLAAAGYEVWSDLTKLIGGEVFWDDVEDAIRNHAAKVLCLVSSSAVTKRGVKKEVSLADVVESKSGFKNFLVPCRINDVDYGEMSVHLLPKTAIDFSEAWHLGLAKLLKRLESDKVPRRESPDQTQLSDWSKSFLKINEGVEVREETIGTNWLPVLELPSSIRLIIPTLSGASGLAASPWPIARQGISNLFSFASSSELKIPRSAVLRESELGLEGFLAGDAGSVRIEIQAAQNLLVDLMKQAWGKFAQVKGLSGYELANRRLCWFCPRVADGVKKTPFVGMNGIARKKALQGHSPKFGAYWHAAIEVLPVLGANPRLTLVQHIVFTTDGKTPLGDAKKMHSIRRRFCRSWWQGQWRDLQAAMLVHLGEGRELLVAVSPTKTFRLASTPILLTSPVSLLHEGIESTVLADEEPPEGDDSDEDTDWDEDDDVELALPAPADEP